MYSRNRLKRTAITVAALTLLVTALAGCGSKETGASDGSQQQPGTQMADGTQSGFPEEAGSQDETQTEMTSESGNQESGQQTAATEDSDQQDDRMQSETTEETGGPDMDAQSGENVGNSEANGGENVKKEYEIEIFCPEEYSKRSGSVKYSTVLKKTYYSTTCEKNRRVNIVLPDGYTEDKKYPVLYMLHGIFGSENDMNYNSVTIQNMMTKGLAKEMIVVYPYMYASKTQDTCTAIDEKNVEAYDNFINDLVTDLMPYIKENYSVAEGKENTAIIGFSMGGRESLAIGLQRPDLFGYVGAIAPAPGLVPGRDWAMYHKGQFAESELVFGDEKLFLLMICCGDDDHTVGTFPKSYHNIFEKNKVEHEWWEIPGSDHGDPAITSGVYNFCKYVFQ